MGIGAFTAFLWKPTGFMLGLLTAFGAGALLSAVTIDIVAEAVELGDFGWLAIGAVIGGLSFEGLNRVINGRGGFKIGRTPFVPRPPWLCRVER